MLKKKYMRLDWLQIDYLHVLYLLKHDAFAILNEGEREHEKLDAAEGRSNAGVLHSLLVEHIKLQPLSLVCGVFYQQ